MASTAWTEQDLQQMATLGINPDQVDRHIQLFKQNPSSIQLLRPARLGDGIFQLSPSNISTALQKYEEAKSQGRFLKFVPASGAATRMFQSLFKFLDIKDLNKRALEDAAQKGDKDSGQVLQFMTNLSKLGFYSELEEVMEEKGVSLEKTLQLGDYGSVLRYLLTSEGLDYGQKPKGLIHFHDYGNEVRTSFEEQLIEGESTASGIHFTVSDEHVETFKYHHTGLRGRRGDLPVDFSVQAPSTQTIAVNENNEPFRDEKGRLVFRPGGHGALIDNLDRLQGDLVFIKNIDNVSVEPVSQETIRWKKILGGYLAVLQEKIFGFIKVLNSGSVSKEDVEAIIAFCRKNLLIDTGVDMSAWDFEKKKFWLRHCLDRPMRVCGVVKNTGEPGGGPFWVKGDQGTASLQIVESAQVQMGNGEQKRIFDTSTHFNPVDLVCGIRDWEGKNYSLKDYVDPNAVFISEKSVNGQKVKALELPGLWNGAMARWTTVFVDVPNETFNPVKTVFDLLKPAHQA